MKGRRASQDRETEAAVVDHHPNLEDAADRIHHLDHRIIIDHAVDRIHYLDHRIVVDHVVDHLPHLDHRVVLDHTIDRFHTNMTIAKGKDHSITQRGEVLVITGMNQKGDCPI